mgnify:CR=1 FL=1
MSEKGSELARVYVARIPDGAGGMRMGLFMGHGRDLTDIGKEIVNPDGKTLKYDDKTGKLKVIGGGSGGGATSYEALEDLPSIEGTELSGDMTLEDIGISMMSDDDIKEICK